MPLPHGLEDSWFNPRFRGKKTPGEEGGELQEAKTELQRRRTVFLWVDRLKNKQESWKCESFLRCQREICTHIVPYVERGRFGLPFFSEESRGHALERCAQGLQWQHERCTQEYLYSLRSLSLNLRVFLTCSKYKEFRTEVGVKRESDSISKSRFNSSKHALSRMPDYCK